MTPHPNASKLLLVAALLLFFLAAIVGFGHPVAGLEWQGLIGAGLFAQVAAAIVA